jgi:hypothetical protein
MSTLYVRNDSPAPLEYRLGGHLQRGNNEGKVVESSGQLQPSERRELAQKYSDNFLDLDLEVTVNKETWRHTFSTAELSQASAYRATVLLSEQGIRVIPGTGNIFEDIQQDPMLLLMGLIGCAIPIVLLKTIYSKNRSQTGRNAEQFHSN